MKTPSAESARAGSVTIKLADTDRVRIAYLASVKKRTPHYLMKEAILEYEKKEEARQNFIAAAESPFGHYKESGQHISLAEFSTCVDQIQQGPGAPVPECHTQGFQHGHLIRRGIWWAVSPAARSTCHPILSIQGV